MSYLYPSLFVGDGSEENPGMLLKHGSPEESISEETLRERREKFLEIIAKIIDIGLDEKRLTEFLGRPLTKLGNISITEYLSKHEEDAAYDQVMEVLNGFYP